LGSMCWRQLQQIHSAVINSIFHQAWVEVSRITTRSSLIFLILCVLRLINHDIINRRLLLVAEESFTSEFNIRLHYIAGIPQLGQDWDPVISWHLGGNSAKHGSYLKTAKLILWIVQKRVKSKSGENHLIFNCCSIFHCRYDCRYDSILRTSPLSNNPSPRNKISAHPQREDSCEFFLSYLY
jgi:hypothetical protein